MCISARAGSPETRGDREITNGVVEELTLSRNDLDLFTTQRNTQSLMNAVQLTLTTFALFRQSFQPL